MKRYFNTDSEVIMTDAEVRAFYIASRSNGETVGTFKEYLNGCMSKNGSLTEIDDSIFWYMHTCSDGIVRIESDEMTDEFGSDAQRVTNIGATVYGFRFMTEDGRILETDEDCQIINWDEFE